MLSLFLTFKTITTVSCYWLKYFLEGAIIKFEGPKKLGLDLCYIALIFFGYNLAQQEPPSGFHRLADQLLELYPVANKACLIILSVAVFLILWILALVSYRYLKNDNSSTNMGLLKQALCYGINYAISILLFLVAVQMQ